MTSVEIEKKYIIKMPELEALKEREGYSESEIVQIYLPSPDGVTRRIRKRTAGGNSVYTKTEKKRIDAMSAFESESEIDAAQFDRLALVPRDGTRPILKKRITFLFGGRLFELDVYPEWERSCILEVELPTRDVTVEFPPFLELVLDVTGDKKYSNAAMSRAFPKELI